jgi:short-chain fatty acids transporter
MGAGLSRFTERWVPDAWVICMMLTAVVCLLAVTGGGASPGETLLAWGDGVWSLLGLAMQFTIAFVAAAALVSSRPVFRWVDRLASIPNPDRPRQAVVLAGIFSMGVAYLNVAVSTVACALLVPFIARRNPRADIRLLIAAAYLGLGTVWHGGLSGTAPLILATPGNPLLEPATGAPIVERLYPITETLFIPFNFLYLGVIALTALVAVAWLHPEDDEEARTLTPEQIDAILPEPPPAGARVETPAGALDRFPGFVWFAALLLAYPLGHSIATDGFGESWNINAYNTVFLGLALILHGRALPFLEACKRGIDPAIGLIIHFPFYGGIFGILQGTGLGAWLGELLIRVATEGTYPLLVYFYSGVMNLFVPSAGSKWLIEAPYLLSVAQELGVSTTTTLLAYAYGDSTSNLIQPMWALPLLIVARMRFGEVVGYTFLVAIPLFLVSALFMLAIPSQL